MPRAYLKPHSWSRVKEEMGGRKIGQGGGSPAGHGAVFGSDSKHVEASISLRAELGRNLPYVPQDHSGCYPET